MIINDLFNNKTPSLSESMSPQALSKYCEELVAEKGWDAAYKHARFMAQGATDPAWGSVLKYLQSMKDGVAEGSELKQAKRKYNQAAKDANLDQVGAGKKIDTMKKSLRQKDLGKEQGITEAHNAAAKEIHGNLFHNSIPPGAEKHHVSAVLKAHGLKDTDAKDVINRVRKMGYAGPRLGKQKKEGVAEGRFQDENPEYGGKDPNKTMFYDRNVGDYVGEPWSDVGDNWSGDSPVPAPSVSNNPTIRLRDRLTGKEKDYDIDSPEAQEVIAYQKQQTANSPTYKAVVDAFTNVKPAPPGNLATITSDNDWQDVQLGRYDVNFPDKFRSGQSTITKPSPNFDPQNIVQVEPKPPLVWPTADNKQKSTAADPEKVDNSGKAMRWDAAKARMVPVEPDSQVKTVPTSQSLADKEKEIPSSNSTFYTYKSPEQKSAKLSSRAAGTSKNLPSATPKPGSWQELAKLNNITDPRKLQAGTRINTPDGGSIYVNKGDTLSGIAQKMRGVREGRMVKGPGGVPLDRQGRPVPPKVKPIGMQKWLVTHSGSHGEGGKDIIEAPNFETAWEIANEYDLDIIDVKPYRGPARLVLVDEGNPVPGQNFTTSQGQQMNWNPTTKSWASTGPAVPSDGFDVVSNVADMRTTDTGNKPNSTYTSTTIQKNPTTGQQKSLSSWSHDDPVTGKNYSGTNYIDPEGNAQTQKNYQESKKTKVAEVSLGDYRKKAQLSQATSKIDRFFGRDDPAKVARADQTIAKRERGMARADARVKPYTAPPVDQDKQRRDLADKYPNIDELVRKAELNRDPNYEYADGQAYYNGRDAEHKYHRLKQIQRMIRGAELDEMDFGGVDQTTDSATGDVTTSFNQGPMSVSQTKTPGGYTKQTDQQFNLGTATMGVKTAGPNIGAGQLAGTTTATATNNQTGQTKQQVRGVGFGGATGPNVGKNYVGATNDELAKHAADSFMGANENIDRMKHLAGIKPVR